MNYSHLPQKWEELPSEIQNNILKGALLEALKQCKERYGLSLSEAKGLVEYMQAKGPKVPDNLSPDAIKKCPNCGKYITGDSLFCEFCGARLVPEQTNSVSRKTNIPIEEISKLTIAELNQDLANGARFVQFAYTISIVLMTFKRYSKIYLIRNDKDISDVRLKYSLINIFLGWWGIPFGPIYTIQALIENGKGKDVTREVIESLNNNAKA